MSRPRALHLQNSCFLSRQLTILAKLRRLQQQCRLASTSAPQAQITTHPRIPPKPIPLPEKNYTPQPLSRPIGQSLPPQPGENTGIDTRPWRQRRDDFFDYDKHLARRRQLTQAVAKPYFREWTSLDKNHKGKTFLSPRTLFKADRALYFPNLHGYTLADRWKVDKDTTDTLRGKVSVVAFYSGQWAQKQTESFVQDPQLMQLLEAEGKAVQKVDINVEETRGRAALVWMFAGGLRKLRPQEEWERYFVVRRGLSNEVRMDMGLVNGKVGYVYLVDWECRIRWAGSGDAEGAEKEGLVGGARRLVEAEKRERELERPRTRQKTIGSGGLEKAVVSPSS